MTCTQRSQFRRHSISAFCFLLFAFRLPLPPPEAGFGRTGRTAVPSQCLCGFYEVGGRTGGRTARAKPMFAGALSKQKLKAEIRGQRSEVSELLKTPTGRGNRKPTGDIPQIASLNPHQVVNRSLILHTQFPRHASQIKETGKTVSMY